jgi:hypothetical protein
VSLTVSPVDASGPLFVTSMVYVTCPPAVTVAGVPVIVRARSAPEITEVVCVRVLSVSPTVVELATAVLVSVLPPAAVTVIVMVMNLSILAGTVPKLHTTFGAAYEHAASDAETKLAPAGIGTVSWTLDAEAAKSVLLT